MQVGAALTAVQPPLLPEGGFPQATAVGPQLPGSWPQALPYHRLQVRGQNSVRTHPMGAGVGRGSRGGWGQRQGLTAHAWLACCNAWPAAPSAACTARRMLL